MIIWFSFFTKHLLSLFFFSLVFKTHSQFPSNIMFSIGNCYVCPRLRLRNTHNPFSSSFSCNRRQLWVSSFPLPPPPLLCRVLLSSPLLLSPLPPLILWLLLLLGSNNPSKTMVSWGQKWLCPALFLLWIWYVLILSECSIFLFLLKHLHSPHTIPYMVIIKNFKKNMVEFEISSFSEFISFSFCRSGDWVESQ